MSSKRAHYTDKFRASAVVLLEAEGYPEQEGALTRVAEHLKIPLSTLRGWFTAQHNPPPTELRNEKRREIRDLIEDEFRGAIESMANKRDEANYRDLGVIAGVFFDKMQLLEGKPTAINQDTVTVDDKRQAILGKLAGISAAERTSQVSEQPDSDGS